MGKNQRIADSAIIKENVFIGNNVVIEEDVYIDIGCIIRDNVHIGKGTYVGSRCILGEYLQDFYADKSNKAHPLEIGAFSIIRSETIIYGDCTIGDNFQTGHRVTIREHASIGTHVSIGTLSDIQGFCQIGNYVNMHSNVHISQKSKIHDYVWIFPYVVLTNDPQPPSEQLAGVEIEEFAVISTGSILLPGVHIYKDALVGAGALVTKDVPQETVVFGNPARPHGSVKDIHTSSGERVYPWRYSFDRKMPWNGIGYDAWKKQSTTKLDL
ncbi:N-acetyltransferase [Candidatus Agathobaculum pullicola]|uniref:acyltransferase n=1 Tax=Candidatus Agathobaculum pullicola TaxID=2838426 RepID=UPI003F937F89